MKKLIILMLCAILVFTLCACSGSFTNDNGVFDTLYECNAYIIYQDRDTKVCYILVNPHGYSSGLTVLVDADGKPITEWNRGG